MCGIIGFNFSDKTLLGKMSKCIRHRGPNSSGMFVDKKVSLGHRRLSIIDLSSKGDQPMINSNKTLVIVYNGEIYNYLEIRKELEGRGYKFNSNTDTEVVLYAYEEYGEECLQMFNGFFSFCVYDIVGKKFFIARDRLGIKPLYYYFDSRKFIFSSEMKSILEDKSVKREVDLGSLNEFLTYRYIHSSSTILKNIFRLKPGYSLTFDLVKLSVKLKKYWDLEVKSSNYGSKIYAKNILDLFEDSVSKRLMSDVPLGVYLSGGIDSSAVVAVMKKLGVSSINTYSIGFEHDVIGNELKSAKKVSDYFGTKHHEYMIKPDIVKELKNIVWHLDEPLADPAVVPVYYLSKKASKSVTVVLTGDGGDELFAGYDQYKFLTYGDKMSFLPRRVRKKLIPYVVRNVPNGLMNKIYKYSSSTGSKIFDRFEKFISNVDENKAKSYLEVVSVFDGSERKEVLNSDYFVSKKYSSINKYFTNGDYLNNLTYMDLKTYLPEDLLMKPDKMCMAFGIESRVPFLDHRLVEYAFKIPSSYKLRRGISKYIMKKSFKRLLPKEIIHRKKQPFQVPLDEWISKELKDYLKELISNSEHNYFNKKQVKKIFDNYNSSRLYYGRQLWSLGIFNLWYKIYVNGEKV
tara:strand:+ start:401 stop:2287 length:1887 start_codon:yes stop_codon:yes gene_type:complete